MSFLKNREREIISKWSPIIGVEAANYYWQGFRWRVRGTVAEFLAVVFIISASVSGLLGLYVVGLVILVVGFICSGKMIWVRHKMYAAATEFVGFKCRPFHLPPSDPIKYTKWRNEHGLVKAPT